MKVLPCGQDAALVELADGTERRALMAALTDMAIPGLLEIVPAARTVLLRWSPSADPQAIVDAVRGLDLVATSQSEPTNPLEPLVVKVTYDGHDLADVAAFLGCSVEEVIARHTGQDWIVEFVGFSPGFGYLTGSAGNLTVPRRTSPRTRVPAGAVGLAGMYAGVYPSASSGGWQLIGSTAERMWDAAREQPALFTPGRRVRFVRDGV